MAGDAQTRTLEPGYLSQDVTKVPGWDDLVSWDLLFNNLTTGLFLFAAVGELAAPGLLGPVSRVAYPIALVFLIADLLLLVSDLGDPLRFHHMLRVFKPSSPMSLGTWSLTAYSQPLTLIVGIEAMQAFHRWPSASGTLERVRWWLVIVGLVPAFGSVAYKGVLFSTSSQPGWKDARWLGGWMANSALMLGGAQMIAVSVLTGHPRTADALRHVAAVLLVLNLLPTSIVFLEIRETLWRIYRGEQIYQALALVLVGGTLVPLLLLLTGGGPLRGLSAALLIVAGGLAVRALFLKIPHASRAKGLSGSKI